MGVLGVLLSVWGNPENSGICISCFMENSAGALGLHGNARLQYLRPELPGFVLGAAFSSLIAGEFKPRSGNSPALRFFSGIFLIVGCAIFVGCPIKMLLRLCAGDLTAAIAAAGLVSGVWIGLQLLARGVDLGSQQKTNPMSGFLVPLLFALLLLFVLVPPAFVIASTEGSSSRHAPVLISLASGLFIGVIAQRSRFCITGSLRDILLMGRRAPQLSGFAAFALSATIASLATGGMRVSLYGQPGAHLEHFWSFLGMLLVGWISVMIGGCPFRQLVKAGEGDTDAGMAVLGMFLGGALVQSWGIAATAAGVPIYGKVAALAGIAFSLLVSLFLRNRLAD
ncbi:YedE-related selenium metabolism membrane protein [Geobacter pelophilus]|uniref:YedE-related selenium metabolism membrane protein n=2 Tax=Geoanaerobacter pelophilus TaxID=60036 RepID=A0AAW4LA74_9BACT|nr:YedE-related selenium metabolism membrane protein [Geoanaerobacter pelophilus]